MKIATAFFPVDPRIIGLLTGFLLIAFGLVAIATGQSQSEHEINGFTEPFRSVDLASDETGIILDLLVQQGDEVTEGQLVGRLDSRFQELQLELATHQSQSRGALEAAEQVVQKRESILDRIRELQATHSASASEIIRAEMELSIANSKLTSIREELVTREIESRRAQAQLDRRLIHAPFSGVIDQVHRREGEYLSPLHPEIVTLIQIDRLFATFNVPSSLISSIEPGQAMRIDIAGRQIEARIDSIGVQTDAQSHTVEIRLVIENHDREIRSGEICTLTL